MQLGGQGDLLELSFDSEGDLTTFAQVLADFAEENQLYDAASILGTFEWPYR